MLKISGLIEALTSIMEAEGDLPVCKSEANDYWGSIEGYLTELDLNVSDHAKPDGPKRGKPIKALVIL